MQSEGSSTGAIIVDAKPMLVVDAKQMLHVVEGKQMLVVDSEILHEAVVSNVTDEANRIIEKLEGQGIPPSPPP
jgi:hypothetical protein